MIYFLNGPKIVCSFLLRKSGNKYIFSVYGFMLPYVDDLSASLKKFLGCRKWNKHIAHHYDHYVKQSLRFTLKWFEFLQHSSGRSCIRKLKHQNFEGVVLVKIMLCSNVKKSVQKFLTYGNNPTEERAKTNNSNNWF